MSPMVEDDVLLTKQEQQAALIGIVLGVLLSGALVWGLVYFSSLPASQAEIDQFRQVYGISLSQAQTLFDFQQQDPATHQLQQKVVDGVRWGLVADAGKCDQLIVKLRGQRDGLINQAQATDASIASTKQAIVGLDAQIAATEGERENIRKRWEESYSLALRCRFGDGGASSFETARYKYREWLEKQGSPSQ